MTSSRGSGSPRSATGQARHAKLASRRCDQQRSAPWAPGVARRSPDRSGLRPAIPPPKRLRVDQPDPRRHHLARTRRQRPRTPPSGSKLFFQRPASCERSSGASSTLANGPGRRFSTKYSATPALVAQRIEHRPPEPCAQVRVLPRAPPRCSEHRHHHRARRSQGFRHGASRVPAQAEVRSDARASRVANRPRAGREATIARHGSSSSATAPGTSITTSGSRSTASS